MFVFRRLRKCGESKKETAAKYNGSIALATLERATIMNECEWKCLTCNQEPTESQFSLHEPNLKVNEKETKNVL